ncbi:MAG: hypothetical protein U0105_22420 [Candidatus Obscuribacterales bacterium]
MRNLDKENLKIAYARRQNGAGGAAGIDGLSTDDLQAYRSKLETDQTRAASGHLQTKTGETVVNIPKPGGGKRQLGIPTAADRFIQQAVMQVLQRKWDSTFFRAQLPVFELQIGETGEAARKHIEGATE